MVKQALLNLCIKVTNADFFAQHESDEVQTEISTVAALNVSVDLFRKKLPCLSDKAKPSVYQLCQMIYCFMNEVFGQQRTTISDSCW